MKNIIFTSAFLILGFTVYSQISVMENTLTASESSSVLFAKSSNDVNPTDGIGEWVSIEGHHLTLYNNNKAVWKDDSHIYYMTWSSEYAAQDDNIKISLSGNDYCKHKSFYLGETDNGKEIIEDHTNVRMHLSKEFTATIQ